ncbi:hypothetical protein AYI69_g4999 [Smittium culicis]|uniref:Endonuclease/exonuclease/phosphatase domain-containing protein n=1 Tax=Smittium culicis TaxID=133412 RepID=A0A1R1Y934_9FUNG|nr:hypothetical protein AYI69_g4999 [Smittium culicis]
MLIRHRPKLMKVQEALVFHESAREGSNHGVSLGISKGHVAQIIPGIEGKLVEAQAQLDEQTIKSGSFYLPCNSTTERASNKRKHLDFLQTWSFDNLEEPCIIAGDFSMSNSALGLLLKRYNTGYSVFDFSGSIESFFGNGDKTWSCIDHIIVNEAAKGLFSNARVNRGYNISDHWQILGSVFSSRKQAHKNMTNLEDTSNMEADEIAATFVETSKKNAVDLTLYKASNRKPKRFYLTQSILKEIRAKDLASAEWNKATESMNPSKKVKKLYLAFSKKSKEVKELIQTFNCNRWAKFLDKGAKIVAIQNGRDHKSGDIMGNSRNPDRWIEVLGIKKDNPLDINQDISWDEVRMILMSLVRHKAPDGDGLEVGWYKILFNDYGVYCPESPMAKALLNIFQTIWKNGKIPKV